MSGAALGSVSLRHSTGGSPPVAGALQPLARGAEKPRGAGVPKPTLTRRLTLATTSMSVATKSARRELTAAGALSSAALLVDMDRPRPEVPMPETRRLGEEMLFAGEGGLPVLSLLRQHFAKEGRLTEGAALRLISEARAVLAAEPNVLDVEPPIVVVGDMHGQFYDMLSLFEIAGLPAPDNQFLFLGDYVDRGDFSCEIILYLIACKVCFPRSVFLLRGNHESRLLAQYMTFQSEVEYKYSEEVYEEFQHMFDALPLAAVLRGTVYGDCFVVHGGIGRGTMNLAEVDKINRFVEIPADGPMCDMMWADPLAEWDSSEPEFATMRRAEWENITFVPNSIRHSSVMYGPEAVRQFLQENRLCCIIRGHQVQNEGYLEHFLTDDAAIAPVLTVFSAPNYCDQYNNKGAFLHVYTDRFEIQQFRCVPHPFNFPDYIDGISYSLPFLLEGVVAVLQHLVMQLKQESGSALTPEEVEADRKLQEKTAALYARTQKARQNQASMKDTPAPQKLSKFEQMLIEDRENESRPQNGDSPRQLYARPRPGLRKTVSLQHVGNADLRR